MSFNVDGLNYCELAHDIVREQRCSYCQSPKGVRCMSRGKGWTFGRVLPPSKSHRARIEGYWANEYRRIHGHYPPTNEGPICNECLAAL